MDFNVLYVGAFCFGIVVGWVTYRTLRHTATVSIGDIAAVIGAIGGGVLTLFKAGEPAFGYYSIGLFVGFFLYLIVASIFPQNPWLMR